MDNANVNRSEADLKQVAELLALAGQLLLELNVGTEVIRAELKSTAKALAIPECRVAVSYRQVMVSLGTVIWTSDTVHELRSDMAALVTVTSLLNQVRRGEWNLAAALQGLREAKAAAPQLPRWLKVGQFSLAAASLAGILGADGGAASIAALSAGLGLLARQELARRHISLLALPLVAAFMGSLMGGLAIQSGWTHTPEIALLAPALMLVPGVHLINVMLDLLDNQVPMALARLGLAAALLFASALGVALGMALTLGDDIPISNGTITLPFGIAMVLAAVAAMGFASNFNTLWQQLGMAALAGIAGHGVRYLVTAAGGNTVSATFLGSFAVGMVSAWLARKDRTPAATIAFAGAVTMMPGLVMYRALGGAMKLASQGKAADPQLAAETFAHAVLAGLIVGGLTIGLALGVHLIQAIHRVERPIIVER